MKTFFTKIILFLKVYSKTSKLRESFYDEYKRRSSKVLDLKKLDFICEEKFESERYYDGILDTMKKFKYLILGKNRGIWDLNQADLNDKSEVIHVGYLYRKNNQITDVYRFLDLQDGLLETYIIVNIVHQKIFYLDVDYLKKFGYSIYYHPAASRNNHQNLSIFSDNL